MGVHLHTLVNELPGAVIIARQHNGALYHGPTSWTVNHGLFPPSPRLTIDNANLSKIWPHPEKQVTEINFTSNDGKSATVWLGWQNNTFRIQGNIEEGGGNLGIIMVERSSGQRNVEMTLRSDGRLVFTASSGFQWVVGGTALREVVVTLPAFVDRSQLSGRGELEKVLLD